MEENVAPLTVSISEVLCLEITLDLIVFHALLKNSGVSVFVLLIFLIFPFFIVTFYRYDSIKAFCLSLIYAIFIADRSIFLRFLCRFWRWRWSGVAAGVRRIEALTSDGLMKYYAEMEHLLKEAAQLIKASPENLAEKITHLQAENKALKGEVDSLKSKMAQEAAGNVLDRVKEVKGVKLLAAQLDGVDMNELRELGDQFKEKLGRRRGCSCIRK